MPPKAKVEFALTEGGKARCVTKSPAHLIALA